MAIWVQGCRIRCAHCCNPEMFDVQAGTPWESDALAARVIAAREVEGISLLGGEPFHQAGPLVPVASAARRAGMSVMIYTGFTLEDLRARQDGDTDALLEATDLLVDGPYVHAQRSARRPWIGSANQRLHHLTERYRGHPESTARGTQSVTITFQDGEMTVSGWPWLADGLRPGGSVEP